MKTKDGFDVNPGIRVWKWVPNCEKYVLESGIVSDDCNGIFWDDGFYGIYFEPETFYGDKKNAEINGHKMKAKKMWRCLNL